MNAIIHRGTCEIGGTLIELESGKSRLLLDAGYPLFLNGQPICQKISKYPPSKLLELGVLPAIRGLYKWDAPALDGIIISHAHLDHYGLLKYVHPGIPVYLSSGTQALIKISQLFKISDTYPINARIFAMYKPFSVGKFTVKPYLMDHSAFDAAAFEISYSDKTVIYSGDFRGHGRKAVCLDRFIRGAAKEADVLFAEGSMASRRDELTLTEEELENVIIAKIKDQPGIALVQLSGQNIDRIVSFYRAALRLGKLFVVDIYTANVLHELNILSKNIPCPSYDKMKVFYPYRMTKMIFDEIGEEYARRFSAFRISRESVSAHQKQIVMLAKPSMGHDLARCKLTEGLFIYSMWQGYRSSDYQQSFEGWLQEKGFKDTYLHTSGHATVSDIRRLISGLQPKKIVPVHTMWPGAFLDYSDRVELYHDGMQFEV